MQTPGAVAHRCGTPRGYLETIEYRSYLSKPECIFLPCHTLMLLSAAVALFGGATFISIYVHRVSVFPRTYRWSTTFPTWIISPPSR
jgi:hypothetical protein